MSQLLRQLRSSGVVLEHALEAALRRQQIYGGSLDTVLLELDLIEATDLAREIAAANQCENASVALLEPGPERPWDALPESLLELGWAMPLRRHLGHVQVIIHPEIPAEQREQLERSIEHLQVFSTCEACLAKLAAERRGLVMPQRYAVLALQWKQALAREQASVEASAPAAPWLTAATNTAPYAVPPPDQLAVELGEVSGPRPGASKPASKPAETRSPTFLYGLPVDDDDDDAAAMPASESGSSLGVPLDDDDDDPSPSPSSSAPSTPSVEASPPDPTPTPEPAASVAETEPAPEPAAKADDDVPTPRLVSRGAEARPSASLAERLVEPRRALEQATERDQATDALVRAAMVLSPRVALFGIKREGLRGLASPAEIPDMPSQLVELSPDIEAALEGQRVLDRLTDLDLRMAVGQEMAVPCLFVPVEVQGRPVLVLYVDRNGEEFSAEETAAARDLAKTAGQTLEEVLRRLRSEPASKPAAAAPAPTPTPTPAVTPTPTDPAKPSVFSTAPSFMPPGAFKPPPTLAPPPAIKPIKPPSAPLPASSPAVAAPPAPPSAPEPAPPSAPDPAPSIAAEAPASAPPSIPPVRTPPPASPEPAPPSTPDKPPVRLKRVDSQPPGSSSEAAPGKPGTVRGRIVIDDEDENDRPPPQADADLEVIDSAILAAMRGGSAAIQHLRELGEPAFRRIARQFPGELDVTRRDLDTLPPLPAHGPLIRVALELPELGPYLVDLIEHPSPTVRFYVAFVFMELRHPRAIVALGELAFDPDADVRAIAMRVLETYSGEDGFAQTVAEIRRELDSPNRTRSLHATRAVGTVRDIAAVSKLIDLLASKERYIQEAALESLCSITGQQLGLKPHRWHAWYADNAHHHRVEWIISSLAHKDLSVRRWAADELRRITGQRINFLAAGTKQEREIGIRKWLEWWNERGRAEFGG
ncbi:MAG: hypothetical protein R6X02_10665 [Enhygromyxa sp.]